MTRVFERDSFLASLTEAERQKATALQQAEATRFAGLGMQQKFGQTNPLIT